MTNPAGISAGLYYALRSMKLGMIGNCRVVPYRRYRYPDMTMQPIAIVCGSNTPVGGALAARLHGSGTSIITIDLPGAAHPNAALQLAGNLADERDWRVFAQ